MGSNCLGIPTKTAAKEYKPTIDAPK